MASSSTWYRMLVSGSTPSSGSPRKVEATQEPVPRPTSDVPTAFWSDATAGVGPGVCEL